MNFGVIIEDGERHKYIMNLLPGDILVAKRFLYSVTDNILLTKGAEYVVEKNVNIRSHIVPFVRDEKNELLRADPDLFEVKKLVPRELPNSNQEIIKGLEKLDGMEVPVYYLNSKLGMGKVRLDKEGVIYLEMGDIDLQKIY